MRQWENVWKKTLIDHAFPGIPKLCAIPSPKTKFNVLMMSVTRQNLKKYRSSAYFLQYTAYKLAIPSRQRISAEGAFLT